jgi:hypothetical protein
MESIETVGLNYDRSLQGADLGFLSKGLGCMRTHQRKPFTEPDSQLVENLPDAGRAAA